jgi:hypothetical protein
MDEDKMLNRRDIAIGMAIGSLAGGKYAINSAAAASPFFIPYDGTFQLSGPLATCADLKRTVEQMQVRLDRIRSNDHAEIDHFIQEVVKYRTQLENELGETKDKLNTLEKSLLVQKAGLITSTILLVLGGVVVEPLALGALLGLSLIGGTIFLGLQAVYVGEGAPKLVISYTKDRAMFIGEQAAENAGSTGGKLILKGLSIVGIVVDVLSIKSEEVEREWLVAKLSSIIGEADQVASMLKRYSPKDRAPWKTILMHLLSGSILQLQSVISANGATNCLINVRPKIVRP